MRYGLPYKGSKNSIAEWIIDNLPSADVFCDLFFGGGAVTHRALLSGKYNKFIANDIDGRLPILFKDCVFGKHTVENHPEWITRVEFNERKADDAFIALIWSFGSNGKDYIYGADIEDMKRAYHMAVYHDDVDSLKPFGFVLRKCYKNSIYERYLDYQRQIKNQLSIFQLETLSRLNGVERLQSLQSLQSLQGLQGLQCLQNDYSEVAIPQGALIYCDIPYNQTNCGKYQGFDNARFIEWARKQENIFISEYSMPEDFIKIAETEKQVLSAANGNSGKAIERLYINQRTYERLSDFQKDLYKSNTAEQLTIFDWKGFDD